MNENAMLTECDRCGETHAEVTVTEAFEFVCFTCERSAARPLALLSVTA